jgi:predicted GNAT family N-acyltransferase
VKARLSPDYLRIRFEQGAVAYHTDGGHIVAYAILWPTTEDYLYELGTVWVAKSHRGNWFMQKVISKALARVPQEHGARVLVVSKNQKVIAYLVKQGFATGDITKWEEKLLFRNEDPMLGRRTLLVSEPW